jgi:superfamily II DNA or RNA helicase
VASYLDPSLTKFQQDLSGSYQLKFEHKTISDACGKTYFARGLQYFKEGRVLSLEFDAVNNGIELIGVAQGSLGNVYEQTIFIDFRGDYIEIDGECSCPVTHNCKHVAALCLQYKAELETPSLPSTLSARTNIAKQDGITRWLTKLTASATDYRPANIPPLQDWLIYVLSIRPDSLSPLEPRKLSVKVCATHHKKNGKGLVKGREVALHNIDAPHYSHLRHQALPIDLDIGAFLSTTSEYSYWNTPTTINGRSGAQALSLMLQTGRCYWQSSDTAPLQSGEQKQLQLRWEKHDNGELELHHNLDKLCLLLDTQPPMYLDIKKRQAGLLEVGKWSNAQLSELGNAPRIPAAKADEVTRNLLQNHPELPLPPPAEITIRENDGEAMNPCLTLTSFEPRPGTTSHCLLLDFDYAGDRVQAQPFVEQATFSSQDDWVRLKRNKMLEDSAIHVLTEYGFNPQDPADTNPQSLLLMPKDQTRNANNAACWADFIEHGVDTLRAEGWLIEVDNEFHLRFEQGDWEAQIDADENDNDWFSLRFDLNIGDESLPLAPLLIPLLEIEPDTLPDIITLPLGKHRFVRIPSERILPFLSTLRELFSRAPDDNGELRISRFDAITVDALAEQGAALKGAKKLRELAKKLKDFDGIKTVKIPKGLQAELRPYQHSGLNWLQFLREYRFAGILADDMGLGKTVQTLAHLLVEKNAGRLDKPALVVAPTSLMGNWRREAEHFAPELRVTVLHGNDRHVHFADMANCDLLLTTYPLLSRDSEQLQAQRYHSVILDEAQAIKNSRTKMAQLVRQLHCDHRLCLTGTPLENHLGELWSLFDFLMPGFLGDSRTFKNHYRTPIEIHGDIERQHNLSQRVQPFLLRREKDDVASELPPKTEIQQTVELQGKQAELYESIRLSMDQRVREAIKNQGLARSHITILDALLKLRQVCCDPRLLKLDRAKNVTQSAKLELLMDLLPEQLEEGRRIILFSQFTSMLSLIEDELHKHGIEYSKLTGQTRKRDEAIQRFREGDVNLFLISLKAGGTGLNLTEADTVILYDPWWNPAVESQAIDRAHRIGQDKPVFIYRLMVSGSVEEKMLAMQDKKRALAKGIYAVKKGDETPLLDTQTLQSLFAPLAT